VVIARHLHDQPPDPRTLAPELSAELCAVIARMMAKDRERRYANVAAVDLDLYRLQHGAPTNATATADPTPSRLVASAPAATPPVAWDSGILHDLEERLAACVGPMARVLVRKAAESAANLDELCRLLAEHIPSETERATFLTRASATSGSAPRSPSDPALRSSAAPGVSRTALTPSAGGNGSGSPEWGPGALAALEQRLAASIGPVARVLVKKASKSAKSWDDMVASLAANLPTPAEQAAFRDAARAIGP
jgi:hypothetical protein